jgi:fructose-1,6-bisphosphatase
MQNEKTAVIHYPRLDTVLMVEKIIQNSSGEFTKTKLWKHLPKQIMYQTFDLILDYLEKSGKIAYDKENKIAWVYNPKLVKRFLKEGIGI